MAVIIEAGREYKDGHGEKRGPMTAEREWFVDERGWGYYPNGMRMALGSISHPDHIVSEWADPIESPIRTVTRREVVPGVYDKVRVDKSSNGKFFISLEYDCHSPSQLRSAAMVLSQLAEFLDEDKGDE